MTTLLLYKKLTSEELDNFYLEALKGVKKWFENNPKRRVCNVGWCYGQTFKVRKNNIEKDIEKMYIQTKLESFKNG